MKRQCIEPGAGMGTRDVITSVWPCRRNTHSPAAFQILKSAKGSLDSRSNQICQNFKFPIGNRDQDWKYPGAEDTYLPWLSYDPVAINLNVNRERNKSHRQVNKKREKRSSTFETIVNDEQQTTAAEETKTVRDLIPISHAYPYDQKHLIYLYTWLDILPSGVNTTSLNVYGHLNRNGVIKCHLKWNTASDFEIA